MTRSGVKPAARLLRRYGSPQNEIPYRRLDA
jgi:hypothetical protein